MKLLAHLQFDQRRGGIPRVIRMPRNRTLPARACSEIVVRALRRGHLLLRRIRTAGCRRVSPSWASASARCTGPGIPQRSIRRAEAICVGGGNTFALARKMQQQGLMQAILRRIRAGVPYVGWSAGSNVCCPTISTTNDMPIVQPESFRAIGAVKFQINPHYLDANPEGHAGETRERRMPRIHRGQPAPLGGRAARRVHAALRRAAGWN